MQKIYDYIIIGSGFGGSASALRLTEKGYSVLVIEQGKRFNPKDYPKTNWNLFKYLWVPGLRMFGIQKLSFYREASILTGIGVGGGSLVYANTLFKPPEKFYYSGNWSDFKNWESELEPYYEKAGKMMGRTLYDRQNYEDILLRKVAAKMNCADTFQNVYVAVYFGDSEKETDPYFEGNGPMRKGCNECGGCMVGCRENAKNTLDKNYLWFAQKNGAEILPETKVIKLEQTKEGYILHTRSVTTFFKHKKQSFQAKNVIVSGGTLGTLNFLLKQKYKYKTLPDLSDKLGENLLTNSETLCAVTGSKMKLNNGLAITSVFHPDEDSHIEIVKYPDGSNAMKWFFSLATPGAGNSFLRSLNLIKTTFLSPIQFLKVIFNFKWSTNTIIFLVMQSADNAMKMKWEKGLFGGKMKINNRGNKRVPAYIDIGQKVMNMYAKEIQGIAQNIILEVMLNRPTTAHILGGCLMSKNLNEGVVNEKLEVHGYKGLYIIDGSILQVNPGVNPSYSILAMAEYAMDQIPEKEVRGT